MPTTTIHSATSDGRIESIDTVSYANARAGTGEDIGANDSDTSFQVGQDEGFTVHEVFLNFDVSALAGATINSATLSLWLTIDASTVDFVVQARAKDWGDTLTTADFVPGADLSALTLLASIDTNGIGATGAYKALTSEAALLTAIEAAAAGDGILRLMLCSSRTAGNNEPSSTELVTFSSADATGTTQDPKLDIDYTEEEESSSSSSPSSQSSLSSSSNSSSSSVVVGARQLTAASTQLFTRTDHATFDVGASDFWIHAYIYRDSIGAHHYVVGRSNGGGAANISWVMDIPADEARLLICNGSSFAASLTVPIPATTWKSVFAWMSGGNLYIRSNMGSVLSSTAGSVVPQAGTLAFQIGSFSAAGVATMNGRLARVGFAKPPTALGDGSSGTLANTIASALYNEGIGLYWSEISGAQRTAWGLVADSGVYHDMDETSGDAIEEVAGLNVTAVNGPTGAPGPDAEEEQSPSSSSSSSSSVSSSSSSSSSSVQFSSSSSSSSSSPSSQSSASSLSSLEFSSSSSSSSTSSSSTSSSSPSSISSQSSASSESSSSSSLSSQSSSSSLSSQSSSSSSSLSSQSSLSSSSSSISSSLSSSFSSSSLSSSIIKYGTGERIILVIP